VILAHSAQVVLALQRETRAIPIVFVNVSDPIGAGLMATLARPGGNFTGVLHYEVGIVGKWLAMLKEIAPGLARAAPLADPKNLYSYFRRAGEVGFH
jgi:putative tryptophan/tyrosine transport system substrate-binding protein